MKMSSLTLLWEYVKNAESSGTKWMIKLERELRIQLLVPTAKIRFTRKVFDKKNL
jgi:hypothetical protein